MKLVLCLLILTGLGVRPTPPQTPWVRPELTPFSTLPEIAPWTRVPPHTPWMPISAVRIDEKSNDLQRTTIQESQDANSGGIPHGESRVTVVHFQNGKAVYTPIPLSGETFIEHKPNHVPTAVPTGLPANYLNPTKHGRVINFIDDKDKYGTRVVSRKYEDGYIDMETVK